MVRRSAGTAAAGGDVGPPPRLADPSASPPPSLPAGTAASALTAAGANTSTARCGDAWAHIHTAALPAPLDNSTT